MTSWIAVTERLPDDDELVLVALSDGEVWTGYHDADAWMDNVTGSAMNGQVTHWQSLPEPPL